MNRLWRIAFGKPTKSVNPLSTKAGLAWWDQYYFATERDRARHEQHRRDFARLIWQIASPKWNFEDAAGKRTGTSFDNPNQVAIVIHNYLLRNGLAEGDCNGASHPNPHPSAINSRTNMHTGINSEGVGHNLAQEAPQTFAQGVIDAD